MLKYVNSGIVFQEIPDEISLAINISNCPNDCVGCHSDYLKHDIGDILDENSLEALVSPYRDEITCLAFMGGDNDPNQVMYLADWVHRQFAKEIKTAWYSGKTELPNGFRADFFDYVKLGPYIKGFGPLNSKTTNQRLYHIVDGKLVDITSRFWKK